MSVRQIWVLRGNFVVAPILLGHFVTTDVGERKPLSGREDYNEQNVSPCILLTLEGETRSVFANDKFVKLMQDVTRQRKIFEK